MWPGQLRGLWPWDWSCYWGRFGGGGVFLRISPPGKGQIKKCECPGTWSCVGSVCCFKASGRAWKLPYPKVGLVSTHLKRKPAF